MQQIIEVEHCGNDHLEPIYSICEIPVHGFPKPQSGGLWTSPIDSEYSWRKWCLSEDFNVWQLEKSFRLKIDTSQLLIIDSLDDLIQKWYIRISWNSVSMDYFVSTGGDW